MSRSSRKRREHFQIKKNMEEVRKSEQQVETSESEISAYKKKICTTMAIYTAVNVVAIIGCFVLRTNPEKMRLMLSILIGMVLIYAACEMTRYFDALLKIHLKDEKESREER